MNKRILAVLLCLVLVVGLLPFGALAAPNADVTYVAFTSDVHNQSNNTSATRLGNWLSNVSAKLGQKIDTMCFCGDCGAWSDYNDSYWTRVQTVIDTVKTAKQNGVINNYVFTTGNHEYMNGSYSASSSNAAAKEFQVSGEAIRG